MRQIISIILITLMAPLAQSNYSPFAPAASELRESNNGTAGTMEISKSLAEKERCFGAALNNGVDYRQALHDCFRANLEVDESSEQDIIQFAETSR